MKKAPALGYGATAPRTLRVTTPGRGIYRDGRTVAREDGARVECCVGLLAYGRWLRPAKTLRNGHFESVPIGCVGPVVSGFSHESSRLSSLSLALKCWCFTSDKP